MKFSLGGFITGALAASAVWYGSLYFSTKTSVKFDPDPPRSGNYSAPVASGPLEQPGAPAAPSIAALSAGAVEAKPPPEPTPSLIPETPAAGSRDTDRSNGSHLPVQSSHEHAQLIRQSTERKTMAQLHHNLETEERDTSWAPAMESLISEFLLEHDFIEAFSINHITCKSTLCEIQAFGYEGHEQWNTMMSQMQASDWFREFRGTSTASSSNDGKATVVTILHRKQ